jgi:hypothetical protein
MCVITDIAARDGSAVLVRRQLARAAEQHAAGPRASPATDAGNDEVPSSPPSTVWINRPCGVVMPAHTSCNERNAALAAPIGLMQNRMWRPSNRLAAGRRRHLRFPDGS